MTMRVTRASEEVPEVAVTAVQAGGGVARTGRAVGVDPPPVAAPASSC